MAKKLPERLKRLELLPCKHVIVLHHLAAGRDALWIKKNRQIQFSEFETIHEEIFFILQLEGRNRRKRAIALYREYGAAHGFAAEIPPQEAKKRAPVRRARSKRKRRMMDTSFVQKTKPSRPSHNSWRT